MDFIMSAFEALMHGSLLMLVSIDLILASLFDSVAAIVDTLDERQIFCSTCCVCPTQLEVNAMIRQTLNG
jgi:hypothetical protein